MIFNTETHTQSDFEELLDWLEDSGFIVVRGSNATARRLRFQGFRLATHNADDQPEPKPELAANLTK